MRLVNSHDEVKYPCHDLESDDGTHASAELWPHALVALIRPLSVGLLLRDLGLQPSRPMVSLRCNYRCRGTTLGDGQKWLQKPA